MMTTVCLIILTSAPANNKNLLCLTITITTQPNFVKRNVIFSINTHLIILDTTCESRILRCRRRRRHPYQLRWICGWISNMTRRKMTRDKTSTQHHTALLSLRHACTVQCCTLSYNDCDFASTTTFMNIAESANSSHLPSTSMMWWKYEARQSLQ